MQYDWKVDTVGGVTITRLADGATRYLQFEDDVAAFNADIAKLEKCCGGVPNPANPWTSNHINNLCAPYFEE